MNAADFEPWLQGAVAEVLESMCFLFTDGELVPMEDGEVPWIGHRLAFHGPRNGSFGMRTPLPTARLIACNFLGEEEQDLSDDQASESMGEMANMVCGALLSRIESAHSFDLSSPEIDNISAEMHPSEDRISRTFPIEEGRLIAWLEMEPR